MERNLLLDIEAIKKRTGKTFGMVGVTFGYNSDAPNGIYIERESIGNNQDLLEMLISDKILPSSFNLEDYRISSTSEKSELFHSDSFLQVEFINIHNNELSFLIDYCDFSV